MIDRLVCADGSSPDPTSTGGKDAQKAKDIEMKGHLAGQAFSVAFQEKARNAARTLAEAVTLLRQGKLAQLRVKDEARKRCR